MKVLFDTEISKKDAFCLDKKEKPLFIPIVYDSMFTTMLNNEERKQYISLFLAYYTNKDYEYIYNNLLF